MGAGWIVPQLDVQFGCATTLWPSSTKAELFAIWSALLAVPMNINNINIFTDSQSAIDSINRHTILNFRQRSKIPNSIIIEQIWRLMRVKDINCRFVKVKAHTGNEYNEAADRIAKQAARKANDDNDFCTYIRSGLHSQQRFTVLWKNQDWNGVLRKNFLMLATLPHCTDWAKSYTNMSRSQVAWFSDNLENVIPSDLLRNVVNVDNIDRLLTYFPSCFVRWDITWHFLKTSHH